MNTTTILEQYDCNSPEYVQSHSDHSHRLRNDSQTVCRNLANEQIQDEYLSDEYEFLANNALTSKKNSIGTFLNAARSFES
jgi:hypothetical protein